ncbi:MAG: hypothetical protein ACKO9I_08015 [Sphaerospermopsis kisseleviana]
MLMNKFIFFSRKDAKAQREDFLNHEGRKGHEGREEEEKEE